MRLRERGCGNGSEPQKRKNKVLRVLYARQAERKSEEMRYLIPTAPVSKKNSQRIVTNRATGRPFIIQSQQYEDFETTASYFLKPKPEKPIDYPVTVKCLFYMPTHRRVDTSNLVAAVHDILVKCQILADDNRDIIASTDGTRTFYDKANPRVEIEITKYEGVYETWAK